ncbi:hypothetical protein [Arthrobacter zhaoguopingii]|uniref:hypothetical protein n=1 Tax=Arthrobacter zhaoguopingii TaxID=2681491 RepID=UPI001358F175|nr:hypothetical protein [Arthrobacter zhaoguopingii]
MSINKISQAAEFRVDWSTDPIDGGAVALLSFDDPDRWHASAYHAAAVDEILADHPNARVRVRVADRAHPGGGWSPYMSYVALGADDLYAAPESPTRILDAPLDAAHPHIDAVRTWLLLALRAGYGDKLSTTSAELWLNSAPLSGRWTSLVALEDERPVGHLTLAPGVLRAEAIPIRYSEIIDTLVDLTDRGRRRLVESALVARAGELAAERNEDLLGSVVHPDGPDGPGWRIVDRLVAQGWRHIETIWTREVA